MDRKKKKTSKVLDSKILIVVFTLFVLLINVSKVFAITSSGSDNANKLAITAGYDIKCCAGQAAVDAGVCNSLGNDSSTYYKIGGVYISDKKDESKIDELNGTDLYETDARAEDACDDFVVEKSKTNTEEDTSLYLCNGTGKKTGYACVNDSGIFSGTKNEYLEEYINDGKMFTSEKECLEYCNGSGICTIKDGYYYKYTKSAQTVSTDGSIEVISGRIFTTEDAAYAFCIQPSKKFTCPAIYKNTGEHVPQYCLNSSFELNECGTDEGFASDYRCGLAYISLKGTNQYSEEKYDKDGNLIESDDSHNNDYSLTNSQYAAIDMAMRMWASYKGKISGTESTEFLLAGGKTTSINFYGITAKRVDEDATYLQGGLICAKSPKNIGVACTYTASDKELYDTYKQALALFNKALNVNRIDNAGNKVPVLVTKTIGNATEVIQTTNPTGKECSPEEEGCKIHIILCKDAECNETVKEGDTYCDKNFCYSKIETEKEICEEFSTSTSVKVIVEEFEVSGQVREYYNCNSESNNQIMFVVDAKGKETTTTTTYTDITKVSVNCTCTDDPDTLKTTVGYIQDGVDHKLTTNESKHYCDNHDKMNSEKNDYDGYETGYIKDPSMGTILSPQTCDSSRKYFEAKEYETAGDTCKIYCRNEIEFYLANKEKVYSGMQFRYELEEKLGNNLGTDKHITSIVHQIRECVSEINYDSWKKQFEEAEKAVANAWNEWKKWDTLRYKQNEDKSYPSELSYVAGCTASCDGICSGGSCSDNTSLRTTCNSVNSSVDPKILSSEGTVVKANETCENYNASSNRGTKNGVCNPECISHFSWSSRNYNAFEYSNGIGKTSTQKFFLIGNNPGSGVMPISTLSCSVDGTRNYSGASEYVTRSHKFDKPQRVVPEGYDSCSKEDRRICYYTVCDQIGNGIGTVGTGGRYSDFRSFDGYHDSGTMMYSTFSDIKFFVNRGITEEFNSKNFCSSNAGLIGNTNYTFNSSGTCNIGENGDIDYVFNQAKSALANYNAAQSKVQELLTQLQNCHMYGSGLDGESEQDIKYYTLTKGSVSNSYYPGFGSGSGGGGAASGAPAPSQSENSLFVGGASKVEGAYVIDESITNYKNVKSDSDVEYKANTLEDTDNEDVTANTMLANPEQSYKVSSVATTNNSVSIKKKILQDASCLNDGKCVELGLEYEDTQYGKLYNYPKIAKIIDDPDVYNIYCTGENCYQISEEDIYNGWPSSSNTVTIKRIVCDITAEDPEDPSHKCELVDTTVPNSNYVSFKVTTELDFYRDKSYYAQAFTGNVIESKANTNVDSSQYTKLGDNIYPIANNKNKSDRGIGNNEAGSHFVNYTFSNINISAFSKKDDNKLQVDTYNYECSYEVYNNTTGYDCVPQYDSDGNQITCVNDCFDVEGNITDICIDWSSGDSKSYGFVFKNVDLLDMFPGGIENRNTNWSNATQVIEQIQNSSEDMFINDDSLALSVTLNPDSIKKIREYNRFRNTNSGGYLDYSLTDCQVTTSLDGKNERFANCRSSFIDEIATGSGVLGITTNGQFIRGSGKE